MDVPFTIDCVTELSISGSDQIYGIYYYNAVCRGPICSGSSYTTDGSCESLSRSGEDRPAEQVRR